MGAALQIAPELGGECQCGRGETIGTVHYSDGRLWFRAFHNGPAAYHEANAVDWCCADCIADAAVAVASGEVKERMNQFLLKRRREIEEMMAHA
jgi:hypothetical protein